MTTLLMWRGVAACHSAWPWSGFADREGAVAVTGKQIDAVQGVVGLIGVTIGLIPLARWAFTGEHGGLFEWSLGKCTELMGLLVPLATVLVGVGMIAALEGVKRRKRAGDRVE
ncbi:hypothetical protein [Saccharopolyspora erythraea]|uniref:hypothetical protein n=1 Tax=Saccharopolyspora erythraea TaxID=1836 RepID=UPI001179B12C|nr:hypothetical protein [Saccharopolyspora erythraea]QRK91411.1 hypothetical protein JQX30_08440 [Saccharopolyspora erythraea]